MNSVYQIYYISEADWAIISRPNVFNITFLKNKRQHCMHFSENQGKFDFKTFINVSTSRSSISKWPEMFIKLYWSHPDQVIYLAEFIIMRFNNDRQKSIIVY